MKRIVRPELLDSLPEEDLRARRSRKDLRRLNRWMGHVGILARELQEGTARRMPLRIADLGSGDGYCVGSVLQRLGRNGSIGEIVFVDRNAAIDPVVRCQLSDLGWNIRTESMDVLDWVRVQPAGSYDWIIANLFLHHLTEDALRRLFSELGSISWNVAGCEPRRSPWTRWACRIMWLAGYSFVTRHDAATSVEAGFASNELSRLWPGGDGWTFLEREAGLFSHLFVARKALGGNKEEPASVREPACTEA